MKNNNGFSVVIAIMITAFLIVVSAGILTLVIQESKNTKLVYNSISTYAGAEGTIEYALLKAKNHSEGFSDKIDFNTDYEANILALDSSKLTNKDAKTSYEISNNSKSYSGIVSSGEFEIIPLYYDNGVLISTNSKNPNTGTNFIIKTQSFKLSGNSDFVWNIIGNDGSGTTFGLVGTGSNNLPIGAGYSVSIDNGNMKSIENDSLVFDDSKSIKLENIKIVDFITKYSDNYLILYNNSKNTLNYGLESNEGFSLPKLEIVASTKIGNYKKNLQFSENKSKYLDILKYSVFNK